MLCIDQGKGCILVLVDLSATLDTVEHAVLFNLLEHSLGISGIAFSLLKKNLQGRPQSVQIDGITSEFADFTCGVPQGSVLGPLNFCIYMYPLDLILRHHCINYHIYDDDTQLYISLICLILVLQ